MTSYWGSRQWYWYHVLSYKSPETFTIDDQKLYYEILYVMTRLLPCNHCYSHFNELTKSHQIKFSNREEMIEWFITAHNIVNKRLGKKKVKRKKADKLYLDQQIDHQLLNEFLKYHCQRAIYGHSPLNLVVQMMIRLIYKYPCKKCRKVLKKYLNKHPLGYYGKNTVLFKKWYINLFEKQSKGHFKNDWKELKP